ncbi:MAG: hypothetical protein TEF_00335 [Rhizobiales bacterium NRL2]|nr:MAG: hypothetical protein TEF_00335 [Rhizobiales bacterium NRL2]
MRHIDTIIVHGAHTPPSMDIGVAEMRPWHTNPPPEGRGWDDIGYNYVIRRSGKTEPGRDLDRDGDVDEEIGAHAYGHNANSIGICLVGGRAEDADRPDFNYTAAQMLALTVLVEHLRRRFPTIRRVIGHRDVNQGKACPCFDVSAFFGRMPNAANFRAGEA